MSTRVPAHLDPPGREKDATPRRHDGKAVPSRLDRVPRRRRVPYLLLGMVLVISCVVGGVVMGRQIGDREAALALSRPVTVGQVLAEKDLREISMAEDSGLAVIPARDTERVAGRTVAYSLPAGALLTRDSLGTSRIPPQGQAMAAVALKDGQFPPGIGPGHHVQVVVAPEPSASGDEAETQEWPAVVVDVRARENQQQTVVSLQLDEDSASKLAAAPEGRVSVVVTHGGAG